MKDTSVVYEWKIDGVYKCDAQKAGEELRRIHEKYGEIDAKTVVDESRPDFAPLHVCFEWDDSIAAEKYREVQAGDIIRNVKVIIKEEGIKEPIHVRAYVHTEKKYQPIQVVLQKPDMRTAMMVEAQRDMESFKRKYDILNELSPVFDAMNKVHFDYRKMSDIEEKRAAI